MDKKTLLAISGSLRSGSYNTAVLEAMCELAPNPFEIKLADIGQLPLFNPDLENKNIGSVIALKATVGSASGLIIASPEYAHGISGPMKNALDWLVSGVEFPYKPIMLCNTSPRASHALAALTEVLTTMSGEIFYDAYVSVPLLGSELDKAGILSNEKLSNTLETQLTKFCRHIKFL